MREGGPMKTAIVTGAAQRIGKAIAERLLRANFRVILHANTSFEALEKWAMTHPQSACIEALIHADLADEAGQTAFVAKVQSSIGTLDLLVHNASTFAPTPFAKIDRNNFRNMMGINLEAPFFITQGLIPQLLCAKNPSVITIVDAMWQRPSPNFCHYAISKAGLVALTRALANELAPTVRVNGVAPGAMVHPSFYSDEQKTKVLERIPFKRLGSVDDVANAVYFLSEEAYYASGEILVVDGGRSIAP